MRRFNSLLTMLIGGVYIAAMFDLSNLIKSFSYNALYEGKYGFDVIKDLIATFKDGTFTFDVATTLTPILIAAGAVIAALTTLFALIGLFTGVKTPFACIFATLGFLVNIGLLIVAKFAMKVEFDKYGFYVLLVASALIFIFAALTRVGHKKN